MVGISRARSQSLGAGVKRPFFQPQWRTPSAIARPPGWQGAAGPPPVPPECHACRPAAARLSFLCMAADLSAHSPATCSGRPADRADHCHGAARPSPHEDSTPRRSLESRPSAPMAPDNHFFGEAMHACCPPAVCAPLRGWEHCMPRPVCSGVVSRVQVLFSVSELKARFVPE